MARNEQPSNHTRVHRVIKAHRLLLAHHTGALDTTAHDGTVTVEAPDSRWCSDGFEIGGDNGERVRVALSLDCRDREAMAWVTTTGGISREHIRGLLVQISSTVSGRFQRCRNASSGCLTTARRFSPLIPGSVRLSLDSFREQRRFVVPRSNGRAKAFVKTFKRDYVSVTRRPDAVSVLERLSEWFQHYNEVHPHKARGYRSPRKSRKELLSNNPCPDSWKQLQTEHDLPL
jgi:putative transposase